jgi:toxin ParE1/3/4
MIEYSPQARHDLLDIWEYHADRASEHIADETVQRIKDTLEHLLTRHPRGGRARPEFGEAIRSLPVLPYVVFYRIERRGTFIERTLHGRRDIRPPLISLLTAV